MGGKSNVVKERGLFDVGGMGDRLVAPQREIMFAFMDEQKVSMLTPREITEQCDRVIAAMREIKTIVGIWEPPKEAAAVEKTMSYMRTLGRCQNELSDTNWETRRLRRRATQAALDAKRDAMPRFGQERKRAVDDAA